MKPRPIECYKNVLIKTGYNSDEIRNLDWRDFIKSSLEQSNWEQSNQPSTTDKTLQIL